MCYGQLDVHVLDIAPLILPSPVDVLHLCPFDDYERERDDDYCVDERDDGGHSRSAAGTFIKGLEAGGELFLEGLSEMGWNAITRLALERRLSRPLLRLFSSSNCSQNQS